MNQVTRWQASGWNSTRSPRSLARRHPRARQWLAAGHAVWRRCLVGVLKNGLNLMAVPSSLQVAGVGILVIVVLRHRCAAEAIVKALLYRLARRALALRGLDDAHGTCLLMVPQDVGPRCCSSSRRV